MTAALPHSRHVARLSGRLALALLALSVGAAQAVAQDEEPTGPVVRLASPQAPPGGETFVTMILENERGQRVTALESAVEFHTNQLTYIAARKGLAAELVDAELEIDVQPVEDQAATEGGAAPGAHARGTRSRITIQVKSRKPIPNGSVVEMRFQVGRELEGTIVKVDQRTDVFTPDGARVENLTAGPGEVLVTSGAKDAVPIVFACFFYMH